MSTPFENTYDLSESQLADLEEAEELILKNSLGKAEEAREMFTKAYSIFLKVLGPDHPHTQQVKSDVD